MARFTNEQEIDTVQPQEQRPFREDTWRTVQQMTDAGAYAIGLPNDLQVTRHSSRAAGTVLVPFCKAVERLQAIHHAANEVSDPPTVIACTHARDTHYLASKEDRRDQRYLSDDRLAEGPYVYCGGIEGAIQRGLEYARYADVICYYSSRLNLDEAEQFATAIRSSFPHKRLGLGFPWEKKGWHTEHPNHGKLLRRMGYEYRFVMHRGSILFSSSPQPSSWVFFDDATEAEHHLNDALASLLTPLEQRRQMESLHLSA
ncbi:MAG TPA: hypothetical protein VGC07_05295 [Granulicella sp.]